MLLLALKSRISINLPVLFLASVCISSSVAAAESRFAQEDTTGILKILELSDKEKDASNKWDNFLKERTHFSNNEYQMALRKLEFEFEQSYAKLDQCIRYADEERDKYSSSWLKDLQKRFGKEYVKKNIASIRFILLALPSNSFQPCKDDLKEAFYCEYRYLEAAKDYVHEFLEFSETLDKEGRIELGSRIMAGEAYIKSFKYPLHSTLSNEGSRDALYSIALKTRKKLDPRLIDFFTHHQFFRRPFALKQAIDDLNSLK